MFDKMKAINFQIHESEQLEFDDITVLTGPTDTGKSALVRALVWLCLNDAESSFMHDDATEAKVLLSVDGHTVKRIKNKDGNSYQIDRQEPFRAAGVKVPVAVQKLLNVVSDNFQEQHDINYWFSMTPGQVAKELNSIVDLSVIDDVLRVHKKELHDVRARESAAKSREAESKDKMGQMMWGKAAEAGLIDLERLWDKIKAMRDRLAGLSAIIEEIESEMSQMVISSDGLEIALTQAEVIEDLNDQCDDVYQEYSGLCDLAKSIAENKREVAGLKKEIKAQHAELHSLTKKGCPLCHQPLQSERSESLVKF